ncbi:MAG TPA: hypothetical protein VGB26_03720 [Nitrospiria bacterium]
MDFAFRRGAACRALIGANVLCRANTRFAPTKTNGNHQSGSIIKTACRALINESCHHQYQYLTLRKVTGTFYNQSGSIMPTVRTTRRARLHMTIEEVF